MKRIQQKRTKGFRLPPDTRSVTRPGKFGNPYKLGEYSDILRKNCETLEEVLYSFRRMIEKDKEFQHLIRKELKGKNLACYCKPGSPCHADILLEFANG